MLNELYGDSSFMPAGKNVSAAETAENMDLTISVPMSDVVHKESK